jgi:hypothetical protein
MAVPPSNPPEPFDAVGCLLVFLCTATTVCATSAAIMWFLENSR